MCDTTSQNITVCDTTGNGDYLLPSAAFDVMADMSEFDMLAAALVMFDRLFGGQ